MQQRRLRLGDILDDYCPRERRITNHAVVAMIEDDVRQTRCTTCDTEHEYKRAKLPTLRRKKDTVSQAYKEVLAAVTTDATMQAAQATALASNEEPEDGAPREATRRPDVVELPERAAVAAPAEAIEARADHSEEEVAPHAEEPETHAPGNGTAPADDGTGRVHRRLIRATLPRTDNQQVQRPVPEFTMRQPQGRAGKFRGRGPGGARVAAVSRGGGYGNTTRNAGGRAVGNRAPGARSDFHRPPRGGQGPRRDKKHSK